jgi:hypothetical protein
MRYDEVLYRITIGSLVFCVAAVLCGGGAAILAASWVACRYLLGF